MYINFGCFWSMAVLAGCLVTQSPTCFNIAIMENHFHLDLKIKHSKMLVPWDIWVRNKLWQIMHSWSQISRRTRRQKTAQLLWLENLMVGVSQTSRLTLKQCWILTNLFLIIFLVLASWFRLKYPHVTIGALASSAPQMHTMLWWPEIFR